MCSLTVDSLYLSEAKRRLLLAIVAVGLSVVMVSQMMFKAWKERTSLAPEFPAPMAWLNTDRPLRLSDLRGKLVMLYFWTYSRVNCMRIITELKKLEREFPDELVVIGVHSAKFTEERHTDNIRQAILRYEIEYPVVNDSRFKIWSLYGAQSWPTVVLIDPEGYVIDSFSGEGVYDRLAGLIRGLSARGRTSGSLNTNALHLNLERNRTSDSLLAFPGKVLADPDDGRLFISDQNHNRIVIADLQSGWIQEVIGSGAKGLRDGLFFEAQFNHPHGLAMEGGMLFIADTDNHVLRTADLKNRTVSTIAGTGRLASYSSQSGKGLETSLNSPWDLAIHEGCLYAAMAGLHQIWRLWLRDGFIEPFAGVGREGLKDDERKKAWLAQSSGISAEGNRLYIADSEASAIRYVDINGESDPVITMFGRGLFEFGDGEGDKSRAMFQHPMGVAAAGTKVYVADTYNNKVKAIDVEAGTVRLLAGSRHPGFKDGKGSDARFYEPGGLSLAGDSLYIADTNNHRIRILNIPSRKVVTFPLRMREVLMVHPTVSTLKEFPVLEGLGVIEIAVHLPEGVRLNPDSTLMASLDKVSRRIFQPLSEAELHKLKVEADGLMRIEGRWTGASGRMKVVLNYIACEETGLCRPFEKALVFSVKGGSKTGENCVRLNVNP